jgi:hypothetical protein
MSEVYRLASENKRRQLEELLINSGNDDLSYVAYLSRKLCRQFKKSVHLRSMHSIGKGL